MARLTHNSTPKAEVKVSHLLRIARLGEGRFYPTHTWRGSLNFDEGETGNNPAIVHRRGCFEGTGDVRNARCLRVGVRHHMQR
jgi:hypothetical protein